MEDHQEISEAVYATLHFAEDYGDSDYDYSSGYDDLFTDEEDSSSSIDPDPPQNIVINYIPAPGPLPPATPTFKCSSCEGIFHNGWEVQGQCHLCYFDNPPGPHP
jgi:hypothetical protein